MKRHVEVQTSRVCINVFKQHAGNSWRHFVDTAPFIPRQSPHGALYGQRRPSKAVAAEAPKLQRLQRLQRASAGSEGPGGAETCIGKQNST